jgi:tetratricopeptide (TPR) repeat protein
LYLRQDKAQEAMATAEQALKVAPANREANRVLGLVYAALAAEGRDNRARPRASINADANVTKAIEHLERAIDRAPGESDPNVRATLARLYVRTKAFDKAIPLLTDLVTQEPGWQDGPLMLAEAYAGSDRNAEAIAWLESRARDDARLLPSLADFYEREHRWPEAASAYQRALQQMPRNTDLKTRYASALMTSGGAANLGKARAALNEVVSARATDARALYLLSQVERRLGDLPASEAAARRVISQNSGSPWGYYALAEALEEARRYQAVVDELAPVVADHGTKAGQPFDVGILLPHLGFAYQETGQHDKAIATFGDAQRRSPKDPALTAYLVEAQIAGKKFGAAIDTARAGLVEHPRDVRLTRLEAQALRRTGKADQGLALLEDLIKQRAADPMAYVALAQGYAQADRGAQAAKVLQDAQARFPGDNAIAFELATVFEKQKKFAEAEAAIRYVLARDPQSAPALNYLGYMLAERGERLDESVTVVKQALQIEPENGSYLDSLGWAYFKAQKLDLAEEPLRRAAGQLKGNSVVQDHYGEVLFKLGRYDEAIAAWTRALAGDGDSIDRSEIDKKIKAAKQKLNKK